MCKVIPGQSDSRNDFVRGPITAQATETDGELINIGCARERRGSPDGLSVGEGAPCLRTAEHY